MNPTFNEVGGMLVAADYDEQDRLLTASQGPLTVGYTYTDDGELLTKTVGTDVTGYVYDLFGNLLQVVLPTTPDPTVIDYLVDGQNRRVGKASTARSQRRPGSAVPCLESGKSSIGENNWLWFGVSREPVPGP